MIKPCAKCARPTRPRQITADLAPGTIIRYTATLCGGCYYVGGKGRKSRAKVKPLTVVVDEAGRERSMRACNRCGIVRQARPGAATCRDCRDVLSPAEYRMWAA